MKATKQLLTVFSLMCGVTLNLNAPSNFIIIDTRNCPELARDANVTVTIEFPWHTPQTDHALTSEQESQYATLEQNRIAAFPAMSDEQRASLRASFINQCSRHKQIADFNTLCNTLLLFYEGGNNFALTMSTVGDETYKATIEVGAAKYHAQLGRKPGIIKLPDSMIANKTKSADVDQSTAIIPDGWTKAAVNARNREYLPCEFYSQSKVASMRVYRDTPSLLYLIQAM